MMLKVDGLYTGRGMERRRIIEINGEEVRYQHAMSGVEARCTKNEFFDWLAG